MDRTADGLRMHTMNDTGTVSKELLLM